MSSMVTTSTCVATIQVRVVTHYGCAPVRICGDDYITTSHSLHIDLSTLKSVFVCVRRSLSFLYTLGLRRCYILLTILSSS